MAKINFERRIFSALGNVNEFPLLSLNEKIAMPKTTYNIRLKGYVGGAMYLVHQCPMALFSVLQSACGVYEWGSPSSDQFATAKASEGMSIAEHTPCRL